MGNRMKRQKVISCCHSSPKSRCFSKSEFRWYYEDIWTEISKYLNGKCLVRLGSVDRWFQSMMTAEDNVWRYACLRDLKTPPPKQVSFKWRHLYAAAFNGSHSYSTRQIEKHIDWMRIGAFYFDSSVALASEKLSMPELSLDVSVEKMIQSTGSCILTDIQQGIWIADLQLVRCPVCNLDTCEGTMQTLDVRHFELFLHDGYKNGSWNYQDIGSHRIGSHCSGATAAIFDAKHLKSSSTAEVLNLKSWIGKSSDWQPKARITMHAVAVNTNLQENEGLHARYQIMKAGDDGPIVSIRISQQLV